MDHNTRNKKLLFVATAAYSTDKCNLFVFSLYTRTQQVSQSYNIQCAENDTQIKPWSDLAKHYSFDQPPPKCGAYFQLYTWPKVAQWQRLVSVKSLTRPFSDPLLVIWFYSALRRVSGNAMHNRLGLDHHVRYHMFVWYEIVVAITVKRIALFFVEKQLRGN